MNRRIVFGIPKDIYTLSCRYKAKRSISISSTLLENYKGPQAKHFPIKNVPMLPKDTFKDRTAFITGGGSGLGKGMATMLSSLGANVAICSRRLPLLEKTAVEISRETGGKILPVQLDVRNPEAVTEAFDKVQKEFGLPSIVINNAAGNFIAPTERLSPNAWRTIVDIVLNGTAYVTLEAGKRLIAADQGAAFLAISTTYTRSGTGFTCPSASAKAGMETMYRSLAAEWGRYGIRFNCIAPGPISTEGAFSRLDPTGEFEKKMYEQNPSGRIGEIGELSNLACYLVSDYASWLNGETIALDGGHYYNKAGFFNELSQITKEQWDMLEQLIKQSNKKEKSGK